MFAKFQLPSIDGENIFQLVNVLVSTESLKQNKTKNSILNEASVLATKVIELKLVNCGGVFFVFGLYKTRNME